MRKFSPTSEILIQHFFAGHRFQKCQDFASPYSLMQDISFCWLCIVKVLLLLNIANGTPILSRNLFKTRYAWSIDFGVVFFDQYPLFGHSKTWRGLFSAVFMTGILAVLLGMAIQTGVFFGIWVMLGDLSASFMKRRLGYIESSRSRMLDTLPESVLPILVLHEQLGLTLFTGILSIMLFVILEILLSPLLYRLHIRKRPY